MGTDGSRKEYQAEGDVNLSIAQSFFPEKRYMLREQTSVVRKSMSHESSSLQPAGFPIPGLDKRYAWDNLACAPTLLMPGPDDNRENIHERLPWIGQQIPWWSCGL